jgi:hypothetical protein
VTETTARTTRAQRMAMPLAREVVKDLAVEHGACIRPIQLRRTNLDTGEVDTVLVPCGHTLAHVCPACAERASAASGPPVTETAPREGGEALNQARYRVIQTSAGQGARNEPQSVTVAASPPPRG